MVSFFKEKSPVPVFLLIVLIAALHAHSLSSPVGIMVKQEDGYLYYLLHPFKNVPQSLPFLYGIVLFITALLINFVFNQVRLFTKSGYTGALAFVLLSSLLPEWNNIFGALIIQSLLIWVFYFASRIYNAPHARPLIYNTGFLAGVCILLYYPAFPLAVILFISLAIMRPFRVNEWFVLLLGIITPLYFMAGYLFLNDNLLTECRFIVSSFMLHRVIPADIINTFTTLGITGLCIMYGLFSVNKTSGQIPLQVRKSWVILFWMFLFFLPVNFLVKDSWPYTIMLLIIPASACIAHIFISAKLKIIPLLVFWILVSLTVYNNWFAAAGK